jgi:dsDNA-specific endonuclease/ATPase MutS2
MPPLAVGDRVQTPLGKGIVREIRNNGRVLVDVNGRALVLEARTVTVPAAGGRRTHRDISAPITPPPEFTPSRSPRQPHHERDGLDLHGLTVNDALARAEQAISDALLSDRVELRLIHGRSGGRIRAALHRRLREISAVRAFHLDPRNPGITIVIF